MNILKFYTTLFRSTAAWKMQFARNGRAPATFPRKSSQLWAGWCAAPVFSACDSDSSCFAVMWFTFRQFDAPFTNAPEFDRGSLANVLGKPSRCVTVLVSKPLSSVSL